MCAPDDAAPYRTHVADQAESIIAGATAAVSLLVTADDTAIAMRSGDVEVLATPRVLALAEEACVAALKPLLTTAHTSVGMRSSSTTSTRRRSVRP